MDLVGYLFDAISEEERLAIEEALQLRRTSIRAGNSPKDDLAASFPR